MTRWHYTLLKQKSRAEENASRKWTGQHIPGFV
jgi:hypothetical protein